jgi:ribosomal protein L20
MNELLKKYESIDQSKLNDGAIKILNRVKTLTSEFSTDDAKNNKIAEDVLNEIIKKYPDSVKIVKRTPKAKPAPKKVAKAKKPATVSTAKKSGNNIMTVAKEIQKAGESWKEAMERAKQVLKDRREQVVQKQKTELEKLYALVKTKKELQGFTKSDIQRDAVRTAKPTGARFVTKQGFTSNQHGVDFPNKLGRKYWETRDRHADRLAPNYPKDTPLLASGGALPNEYVSVVRWADGNYRVQLKRESMAFGRYFNDSFEDKERAEKFAKKISENNKVNYIGISTLPYDFRKSNIPEKEFLEKYYQNNEFSYGGSVTETMIVNMPDGSDIKVETKSGTISKISKRVSVNESKNSVLFYKLPADLQQKINKRLNPDALANGGGIDGGMSNLTMQNVSFAKGGKVKHTFKVGEIVSFPTQKNRYMDKPILDMINHFSNKELVIEKINEDKPYNLADVYIKDTGEKLRNLILNPKVLKIYPDNVEDEKSVKIKDWYLENYPSDDLGEELNDEVTFEDMWNEDYKKYDIYQVMGVGDSLIRERLFEHLAEIKGVSYDVVYRKLFSNIEYAKGGSVSNERMYNFLQDDLEKLEKAINEDDTEQVETFFSYWLGSSGHLKSLETKTNERMYNFLKDDLEKLEKAINDGDKEQIDIFFSYWGQHLESLKMANGGSLPFMTDPNFGNFQNTGAFAEGGYFDKLQDVRFLFSVGEKIKVPQMGKRKLELLDAEIIEQYPAEQNDGTYYPFYYVKGTWENSGKLLYDEEELLEFGNKPNKSFSDGGNIIADTVSAIFNPNEKDGKIKTTFGDKTKTGFFEMMTSVNNTPEEITSAIFIPNEKTGRVYTEFGAKTKKGLYEMINNMRNTFELGGAFMMTDLAGHTGGSDGVGIPKPLSGVSGTYYTGLVGETGAMSSGELFMDGGAMTQNQQVINDASQSYVNYYLGEGASQGIYKDGGSIPNNYEGKTPEEIWNSLSKQQRGHFLYDHVREIEEYKNIERLPSSEIIKAYNSEWSSLDKDIKNRFANHTREGQYAYGGRTKSRPSMRELYIETIASLTNTRTVGVDAFAKEYNLTDAELSNLMSGIGRKIISQSDFITALVGNKNNPKQKEVVAFAKSDKAYKMADGGSLYDKATKSQYLEKYSKNGNLVRTAEQFDSGSWVVSVYSGIDISGEYSNEEFNKRIKKYFSNYKNGGSLGEELMGGQSNSTLKPSGYHLVSAKGREIIVSDDGGNSKERWVKNNGFSGYRLVYKGNDYEFTDSFEGGGFTPDVSDGTQFMSGVYAGGGKIKPFEYKENNATIMINGTKADVKEMYLDYVNNFLSVSRFAEYYNISEKQANSIIESGRKYAKEDGYYADGGDVLPPSKTYGENIYKAMQKFNISDSEARKKYGQYTISQWNELLSDKMAEGGGIRSKEELKKIFSEKEAIVKNLTPKQIAEMWNKNSFGVKEGISKPITIEEAKRPSMKIYLENLLIENELTEDEQAKYFAKGGEIEIKTIKVGDFLQKKDNKAKAKVINIKGDSKYSTEIFIEDLYGNKVSRPLDFTRIDEWKIINEPTREINRIKKVLSEQYANGGEMEIEEYGIEDEIEDMKGMMDSLFTYGGIERGSEDFNKYLLEYEDILGKKLFDKIYKEELERLNEYEVEQNVYTDSDGLTYNSLKRKFAHGGKLDSGVYRVGKPIKVSPILYEQKIVEIFDNGDISTASDYGRKLSDFKSQKYPIITKEQLEAEYKMADGGFMNNVYAKGGSLIDELTLEEKIFFEEHFGKVSPRMYVTDLKHYDETYSLKDVIAIIKAQPEFFAKGGEIADIQKMKKALIAKAKSKGIYENFGQNEVRDLQDKYGYTNSVREFDNWAMNFDLSQMADGGNLMGVHDGTSFMENPIYADRGSYLEDNDGFMKADNEFNYRYPTKDVYIETLDEPIDLTDNAIVKIKEVSVETINDDIDLNEDGRVKVRMGYEPEKKNPEKFGEINPRAFEFMNLPMPTSNEHKND